MSIQTASLHPFHTFHLNANARQIVCVESVAALREAWLAAKANGLPVLLLGGGSNVLFVEDFAGVVIVNQLKGITVEEREAAYHLSVAAGENWHQLIEWCLARGYNGLENLALIPGVAGSAPIQNIGAYGAEFEQFCDFVEVLDLNSGELFTLSREECQFGYRESVFKHQYQSGFAIVRVGLCLPKAWQPNIQYAPLNQLDAATVSAQQIFDAVCAVRRAKLPNPDELGNAGSFFKNPVISTAQFEALKAAYPTLPSYPQPNGEVKIPAGWLIDQCGLKGAREGGAAVHQQQALVLINIDKATGADVVALAKRVREAVWQKFGVEITPEVRFIGAQGEIDSAEITAPTKA